MRFGHLKSVETGQGGKDARHFVLSGLKCSRVCSASLHQGFHYFNHF